MLKKILRISFFAIITIIMLLVLFLANDLTEIAHVLKNIKPLWLFVAFGFLIIYFIINAFSLMIIIKDEKLKAVDSFLVSSIEYFYNGITPSNTGSQPMQVVEYKRLGVPTSRATGALLINSVINQIAIVFLCLLSLIYYKELSKGVEAIKILIIVGLSLNILVLLLYLSIGISNKIKNVLVKIVSFFCKRKIFKGKLDLAVIKFEDFCKEAQVSFKEAFKHPIRLILALFFKTLALIIFYALPFFVLLSLDIHLGPKTIFIVIAMTTFSIAMTCFVPTPGASGGIEFAFKSLFINLAGVTSSVAVSGMLLWRLLTYYILMIISLICYFILEFVSVKKRRTSVADSNIMENEK